jgi:hypothetical protein
MVGEELAGSAVRKAGEFLVEREDENDILTDDEEDA